MFRLLFCLFTLTAATFLIAHSEGDLRPMNAVDMVELKRLSGTKLSPDGRYLLYQRSNTDWKENAIVDRYRLLDLETGKYLPVPSPKRARTSVGTTWWKPDSSGFAYLRRPRGERIRQVYYFDALGSQEMEQLTFHGTSVTQVLWAPDGESFYFVADTQLSKMDERSLEENWVIRPYDTELNREVWRFDIKTRTAEIVVYGDFSVRSVSLSQDGKHLLYRKVPDHTLATIPEGEIWVRNLETGADTRWTDNDYGEAQPMLAPDGSAISFIATVNDKGEPYYEDKVFVLEKGAAQPKRLLTNMAMEALSHAWDADGTGLYILGNTGVRTNLFHYDLETESLEQVTTGDHAMSGWSYDAELDMHIARFVSATDLGEIQVMRDRGTGFVPVTNEYEELRESFLLPKQEAVTWRARDGQEIEGLLAYPIGYEAGQSYPMITITHGGPRSSSQFGSWNVSRSVPVLTGQGYMVLLPNHRGGTGYGDAFMRDMYGAYFRNAHLDTLDGVDAMVERGLADPDRLIKMGWSAGGHMVNRLITETDRFKAASSGAGASSWLSMHGESDVRHSRAFVFGGNPWEEDAPYEQYHKDSPLVDVWKVSTPTLFFVGENDVRVPPTQSIMMYRGVRETGTPTELYVADGEPHNFRKPSHRLFKINTELAWYAKYALGRDYEAVLPKRARRPVEDRNADEDVISVE